MWLVVVFVYFSKEITVYGKNYNWIDQTEYKINLVTSDLKGNHDGVL